MKEIITTGCESERATKVKGERQHKKRRGKIHLSIEDGPRTKAGLGKRKGPVRKRKKRTTRGVSGGKKAGQTGGGGGSSWYSKAKPRYGFWGE